jgi:hypothetical protein
LAVALSINCSVACALEDEPEELAPIPLVEAAPEFFKFGILRLGNVVSSITHKQKQK